MNNDCLNEFGMYQTSNGELEIHINFSENFYKEWCSYSIEEKDNWVYKMYNDCKDLPGMTQEELEALFDNKETNND